MPPGAKSSAIITQFLDGCCERLAAQGKRNWLLIWDSLLACEQAGAHLDS
ncbi:MAG: hypothetical protein ACJ8CB_28935 [Ktedonobacteraceae bacterium]